MGPSLVSSACSLLVLCVLALAGVASSQGQCSWCTAQCKDVIQSHRCPYPPHDSTYEYFLFVLQWPGTFCANQPGTKSCCEGKLTIDDWTIHGLWPEKSQDCYPYCCDLRSVKFSHRSVASFEEDLKTYWPTLSCTNTDDGFHSNEWDKHGTCALPDLEALSDDPVRYYFQRTLELREALPLGEILANASIVPSDDTTYLPSDIIAAIRYYTGATPDLDCGGQGRVQLDEVHFCLDKTLQTYIDCPTAAELDAQAAFNLGAGGGKSNAGPPRKKACNPNGVSIRTIQLAGRAFAV